MPMTSEKLSTRKPESETDKLPCKEVDHHPNMEEVTGIKLRLLVLLKEKTNQHHGTHLNQDKFLMNTSKPQPLSSPKKIKSKPREPLPLHF